jgi:hypothetical protein
MSLSVPKVKVLPGVFRRVKLQKQLSRRYGGKAYPKWVLVLPPKLVRELAWNEGTELEARVEGSSLRIRPQRLRS